MEALPPLLEAASARLPDPAFDQRYRPDDRGIGGKLGVVEQQGVGGLAQRGFLAGAVALVAGGEIGGQGFDVGGPGPSFSISRWRRFARASTLAVTNSFASASGAITVPMSRPSSTAPPRWVAKSALPDKERLAHGVMNGDAAGEAARRFGTQLRIAEQGRRKKAAAGERVRRVVGNRRHSAPLAAPPRDRAARCRDAAG